MGSPGTAGRPLVLVVDDDEPIRHLVGVVLREFATVHQAASASEAMARVQEADHALVILYARLPDGAGVDIARALRARPQTRATPIVLVTGDQIPTDAAPGDIDGYLRKPFDIEELRRCVRGFLGL
ncbi:MAG: two-component system response regulator [Actinomycetota bacterium]|nr:response regulator [Actinomycetota bacterium]